MSVKKAEQRWIHEKLTAWVRYGSQAEHAPLASGLAEISSPACLRWPLHENKGEKYCFSWWLEIFPTSHIINHSPQPLERLKEPSEKPQLQFTRLSGDDQTPSWPHLSGTIWRTPESNSCIMSPVPLTSALLGPGHTTAITGNLPRAYNYLSSCLLSVRGGSKEDRQKSSPIRTLYACFVFEQTHVWASLVAQSKESTCNVCVSEGFPDGASSQEPTCQCR